MPSLERAPYLTSLGDRSLRDWENETGIHRGTLSTILRGKRKPSVDILEKLAKVQGVSIGVMLELIRKQKP